MDEADILIVNTCSFIAPAREEARATIAEAVAQKKAGPCRAVIVTGCLPQRYGEQVRVEFPEVDALVGVAEFPRIAEIVERALAGKATPVRVTGDAYLYTDLTPRLRATPPWTAYLKIAEGCNHRCRFCAVPAIRGPYHSRSLSSIVREATAMGEEGVREINLIAQDTTHFGVDRSGRPRLAELLRRLAGLTGIHWHRLLYAYPQGVTPELIEVMRDHPTVCKYLDLPFQHADAALLRRMGRAGDGDRYLALIDRLREAMPDVALRTSLIVGMPGEGKREFERLLAFLRSAQFDRAGVFPYSREEGTPAATDPDQVPEEVIEERYHEAMSLQQEISLARNQAWVGRDLEVLIESPGEEDGVWIGRSHRDAPEVDGVVYIRSTRPLALGSFVTVRITHALEYDLEGEAGRGLGN
jgi:ribosomal protein S12 methylthiotransferase